MTDLKISELPTILSEDIQTGDWLPVVDSSTNTTKKVSAYGRLTTPFPSVQDFSDAVTAGYTAPDGTVVSAGPVQFQADSSASVSGLPDGWVPFLMPGHVHVQHFTSLLPIAGKASAEASSQNWQTAFQNALSYLVAVFNGGTVHMGRKWHRTTATITIPKNCRIEGIGQNESNILADFTGGAGVLISDAEVGMSGLSVIGSTARGAATFDNADIGILASIGDVTLAGTSARLFNIDLRNVAASQGHAHGLVLTGPSTGVGEMCRFNANKGHGVVFDSRSIFGWTNADSVPGLFTFTGGSAQKNGGYGIASGPTDTTFSNPSVRVIVDNMEIGGNATDAARRVSGALSEVFYRGSNIQFRGCVLKPAQHELPGYAAFTFAGQNIRAIDCRYLGVVRVANIWGYDVLQTQNIAIQGGTISSDVGGAIGEVVLVDVASGQTLEPRDIYISEIRPQSYTNAAATGAGMGSLGPERVAGLRVNGRDYSPRKTVDSTVNNTTTPVQLTDMRIWVGSGEIINFRALAEYTSSGAADIRFNFTSPSGSSGKFGPANGVRWNSAGVVASGGMQSGLGSTYLVGGLTNGTAELVGTIENGETAGWFGLRFAQGTAEVSGTTIHAGVSRLVIERQQ